MRVALVGGKGMLGTDIAAACAQAGHVATVLDLPDFDLCDEGSVQRGLGAVDVVLNCAAYTRVDDAEKERDLCRRINANGAGVLARVCASKGLRLVHISTDYVFNGRKGSSYVETDEVDPLSFYGLTKLEGERFVAAAGGNTLIVRTQSLYGLNGRNFIKAILGQIHKGNKELRVVNDQVSSPTYTRYLADALLRLSALRTTGIVHVACTGGCSWFEFAQAIVKSVGADVSILPRSTAELNYPAMRPAYSVLDTTRYRECTGHAMPTWQEGLAAYLAEEPLAKLP